MTLGKVDVNLPATSEVELWLIEEVKRLSFRQLCRKYRERFLCEIDEFDERRLALEIA